MNEKLREGMDKLKDLGHKFQDKMSHSSDTPQSGDVGKTTGAGRDFTEGNVGSIDKVSGNPGWTPDTNSISKDQFTEKNDSKPDLKTDEDAA